MQIKHLGPWIIGAALLVLSACGGTALQTDGSTEAAFHNWVASQDLSSGTATDESGLPVIPLDTGSGSRSVSANDPMVRLGADYIQMLNGEVDGTALVLAAPNDGGPDNPPVAYGMYQFEGLTGKRPVSLNVECMPRDFHQEYFVGIADYTIMRWHWFGPYTIPEADINLGGENHRFVSNLGNMYFLVVCEAGNGATHAQTTLLIEDEGNGGLPGAPNHLVASDGVFADAVGLTWLPGPGAAYYEIFRKLDGHPDMEFAKIGQTEATEFRDTAVDPGLIYLYKVRAVNGSGFSGWSNVDSGFAGAPPPPPGHFRIDGVIAFGPDHPAYCVEVTLLGTPQPLTTRTLQDGSYHFENLPAGQYIVVPHNPEIWFDPIYGRTVLNADHPQAIINFGASSTELPAWRAWGFVFAFTGDGWEGFRPLGGNTVQVKNVETAELYTVTTNEDGYFVQMELPVGLYEVKPLKEGWNFMPATLTVHIDGVHVSPPLFFCGAPAPPPPPPGECVIEGRVLNMDGHGIPGIMVNLLPNPDPAGGHLTDANGAFRFAGLPHGRYIVFPQNPELMFEPQYVLLDLTVHQSGTAEFHGSAGHAFHRLWGFVFNMEGDAPNHFVPMGQVTVKACDPETQNVIGSAVTNADGFWQIFELPTGMYLTHAEAPHWTFDPPQAETPIDGIHITPATIFRGIVAP